MVYMDPKKNEYLKINSIHVLFQEINNLRFHVFMDLINFFCFVVFLNFALEFKSI